MVLKKFIYLFYILILQAYSTTHYFSYDSTKKKFPNIFPVINAKRYGLIQKFKIRLNLKKQIILKTSITKDSEEYKNIDFIILKLTQQFQDLEEITSFTEQKINDDVTIENTASEEMLSYLCISKKLYYTDPTQTYNDLVSSDRWIKSPSIK